MAEGAGLLPRSLADFAIQLERCSARIAEITGRRALGFRAPYLLAPNFYEPRLYELLAQEGFRWASNREIRFPLELLRPDRLCNWRFGIRLRGCPRAGVAFLAMPSPWRSTRA